MQEFESKLNRRNFLERLAVAGLGSTGALQLLVVPLQARAAALAPFSEPLLPSSLVEKRFPLHVFSKHLQFLDYEAMAEVAAEAGFDGVDLAVRPDGHVEPQEVQEKLPKALKAIQKQGLMALMMTTAAKYAGDKTTQKVLQTARGLGIRYYRTDWLWYDEKQDVQQNLEGFKQQLNALAALNRKLDIIGGYQNHSGFGSHSLGGPIWDLAKLLAEINNPFLGCQYDIRHATVEGGTTWPIGLQLIHPHINSLVLKDFKWGKVENEWLIINTPIGEGMVDFPKFFSLVKKHNISAPISIHFEYEMPEHQKNLSEKQKRQQTIQIMRADVEKIRGYMKAAGLV